MKPSTCSQSPNRFATTQRWHSRRGLPVSATPGVLAVLVIAACGSSTDETIVRPPANSTPNQPPVSNVPDQSAERGLLTGEQLFRLPFPGAGNERTCATCHVPEDNFALTPEHVARVFAANPNDPLFSAIDADDPAAATLTFEHLKRGLIRVWLTLPDNMDVIDESGAVTTPSDRKIFVWRSVPSIADVALTAPYQLDGRVLALEEQAQGAITGHSEGGVRPRSELERIAAYERSLFSNARAQATAQAVSDGAPFDKVTKIVDELTLTEQETRGRELYEKVCAGCHGGSNTATIVDREIHRQAFYALKSDGSGYLQYQVPVTDPPTPVLAAQPDNEFINLTLAYEMYLTTIGAKEEDYLPKGLEFPYYRFRFYRDATRSEITADLPPVAGELGFDPSQGGGLPEGGAPEGGTGDGGGPGDGTNGPGVELDADGNPIVGPSTGYQTHSVDPGRAAITGNPLDFESFDVPSLRGISKTAPYFHNNLVRTLEEVVQIYSDHLLFKWPQLIQPGEKEADDDGDSGPEEVLTREQKSDLVAFLKQL